MPARVMSSRWCRARSTVLRCFEGHDSRLGNSRFQVGLDVPEFHGIVSLLRWQRSQQFIFRECSSALV